MFELAQLTGYKPVPEGTYLQIFIPGKNLMGAIMEKQIRACNVWLEDGRHISAEQRKKAYATINDIASHTGELPGVMKEWLKFLHIYRTGCDYFSLSNCSMDTARAFINTLLDYSLENGIQLLDFAVNRTDDIGHYLYACLKLHKCAICGREGEIHHVDTIGMGNDRKKVDDSEYRKICLCRQHHTEAHSIGMTAFEDRYKVYGIKFDN